MLRPVALLDVNQTLFFPTMSGGESILNMELLNSLKKANIKDISLFTDMIFNQRYLHERVWIISELKKQGFTVHGVITPADLVWHSIGKDDAISLYDSMFKTGECKGRQSGEELQSFLQNKVITLYSLASSLGGV